MKPLIYNLSRIRPPLTGVGRYAIELIREVSKQQPNTAAAKGGKLFHGVALKRLLASYDSVGDSNNDANDLPIGRIDNRFSKVVGSIPMSRSLYRAADNRRFNKLAKPLIADDAIHHDLNYASPPSANNKSRPSVCTVYDLSNVVCPETHPTHRVRYLNEYFQSLARVSSKVITISNAVKSDLVEHFGIDENRIHVTHLAADNSFRPMSQDECADVLQPCDLRHKHYVLSVATLEPRKNLARVLDAYDALTTETKQRFPLVLAGTIGWKSSKLEQRIDRLQSKGIVKQLGYVPQYKLPKLYAGAAAFVYPSLYEGFGLPLLEAMQSGCPSITSNNGALAEVAGGGAILIDPTDVEELAYRLQQVLSDTGLQDNLHQLSLQRAKDFTWSKTARETCKVYDRL